MTSLLRADAQRNLDRILDAARELLADRGLDVSVADVAARAGVGTATIFRRFPTKDDLVAAIVEQRLQWLLDQARTAATSDEPDAVRRFMTAAAEAFVKDRAFCECSGTKLLDKERLEPLVHELKATVRQMLKRAQAAGHVRADLRPDDIPALLAAVAQAGQGSGSTSRRRYLEIVLDGLRP